MTPMLGLYRRLMGLFHGFAPRILAGRATQGKEDPQRLRERLGESEAGRPAGKVVWFHGVSVGESLSALPVIERLRAERPDITVLITSATTTSADILAKRLPDGVIHQFAPIDTPQATAKFLAYWRPSLAVFIESDIWPVLLMTLDHQHIPHVLLSARITEKTYRGWQWFRQSMQHLLSGYAFIMAQDSDSEARLRGMGDSVIQRLGPPANLKTLGAALNIDFAALAGLKKQIGDRFVFLAASTHYGEDSIIAKSVDSFVRDGDLLILVPRHPIKAEDIRLDMQALGLRVAQRSNNDPIESNTQLYLADTLGELGLFFSVANLVIMGGSFLGGIGGHNPLEAARLGKGVITGPDIANWGGIYADLLTAGAAFRVLGPAELSFLVGQLRHNPKAIDFAGIRALEISRREAGTLDAVWSALTPLLPGGEA